MPKVTVLMAVYNGESYLREAIESILSQTFTNFEFLIINDGSTDRSREIILSYNDPRMRLVDNECNLGLTPSLNRGLELSAGEFIARQDADDISVPERLAKQVAFLEKQPKVALLGTWYMEMDPQGVLIEKKTLPCDRSQICWSLLFSCPFVHTSVMVRKCAVLDQVGLYNESFVYAQDYEYWSRIARCLPIANLGEHLVKLRIHRFSMTATYGITVYDEETRIGIANIKNLFGKDNKTTIDEFWFNTLRSFLLGHKCDFNLQEINHTIKEILQLHSVFCRHHGFTFLDYRKHRSMICAQISRQLTNIAHNYIENHKNAVARDLFAGAFFLHWPVVLKKKYVLLFFKLLAKSQFIGIIKRFAQKVN